MRNAQNIDAAADLLLNNFVTEKSAALCVILVPIAVAAMSIQFIQTGLSIARGQHSDPVGDTMWRLARTSFIMFISLTAGIYQSFVVDGLDAIGSTFIYAVSGENSFAAQLDRLEEPFAILGESFWSQATTGILPHVGLLFAAAVVSLSDSVIFSVSIGFYMLAKTSVAIVMAVGPAFLMCAAWAPTQKYAESWLGQALNFIFLKVLLTLTIVMLTSFASQFAEHMLTETDGFNVIRGACALLINCVALTIVLLFHPRLASALFGGASISGVGRAAMQVLLWMLRERPGKPRGPKPNHISNAGGPSPRSGNTIGDATPLYQRQALSHLRRHQARSAA